MKWFVHCYTFSYDLAPEPSAADRNSPKAQISRRGRLRLRRAGERNFL